MKNNNIKRADNWLACQLLIEDLLENPQFSEATIQVYIEEIIRLLNEPNIHDRQA